MKLTWNSTQQVENTKSAESEKPSFPKQPEEYAEFCKTVLNKFHLNIIQEMHKVYKPNNALVVCNEMCHEYLPLYVAYTAQKMNFSIKDFISKCDQIRRKLI